MAASEAMGWRNLMMIGEQQARQPWWHIYRAGIAEGMKAGELSKNSTLIDDGGFRKV
jgi:hypothetical protein